ncbi:MAG: ABC transporter permease [Rubrobacteraceae bacterium]
MGFFQYLGERWAHLLDLAFQHAQVVLFALVVCTVLGVGLGILIYRQSWLQQGVLAVVSTFLTIPSFALFAIMIPILGLGFWPTAVALIFYGLLPVVRNTVTGLKGVNPAVVESAEAMGMGPARRLLRIELPLAWPVIIAGIRVSMLLLIGIAAIAAVVNGPGLGNDIFAGLARIGSDQALNLVLGGTLGTILLALIFDAVISVVSRLTTPKGIR